MHDRPGLLERLKRLVDRAAEEPPRTLSAPPPAGDLPSGCQDVAPIPCSEAVERVYAYLDGEVDASEAERIRCHLEQCERCYPMYNWERLFLDVLQGRGSRPERNPELRERVRRLLDRPAG